MDPQMDIFMPISSSGIVFWPSAFPIRLYSLCHCLDAMPSLPDASIFCDRYTLRSFISLYS